MERHVVDMQRVVSRRRSCERQRRRDRNAHARTTVTLSKTTLVFHHELRSKRRALPKRPSRHKWRERRSTRASAVERHVVDMQRVVSRRRSCERQRRRDRHAHARTTLTSVENDTRFPSRAAVETTSAPRATVAAHVARTTIDPSERREATRRRHATSGEPTPLM